MSRSHGRLFRAPFAHVHGTRGHVRRALLEQLESRHLLASDYLLVLDGIKGESADASHPGAIEIQSFSWGASNPGRVASPLSRRVSLCHWREHRITTLVSGGGGRQALYESGVVRT